MKAFILAAGLGTRLFPYTSDRPKALVELGGKTLLERAIRKVSEVNPTEIIINIHHFGEKIVDFLEENQNFNLPVKISDESSQLLDTGGAILHAHHLLGDEEPFLLYNVDVLSSMDLTALSSFHTAKLGVVTLAVRRRESDRFLIFDPDFHLAGWRNTKTGEEILLSRNGELTNYAFNGIQIIQPEIFPLIIETGKFSLVQMYLRLARKHTICGYVDSSDVWMDLGKPSQLADAEKIVLTDGRFM